MYKKKIHTDNKTGQDTVEAILFKDIDGYVFAKYEMNNELFISRINNWPGVKKQYNIEKKDLPLVAKGYRNKFSGSVLGTRIKDINFIVTKIIINDRIPYST